MKIAICILSVLILLSGCGSAENKNIASSGYICDADISYGEVFSLEAVLFVMGGGVFKIELKAPESLAGITVEFSGEEAKISYKNMDLSTLSSDEYGGVIHLVNGAFFKLTTGSPAASLNGEKWIYEDEYKSADFTFTLNNEGFPTSLSYQQINLKAEFSNWKYQKNM